MVAEITNRKSAQNEQIWPHCQRTPKMAPAMEFIHLRNTYFCYYAMRTVSKCIFKYFKRLYKQNCTQQKAKLHSYSCVISVKIAAIKKN